MFWSQCFVTRTTTSIGTLIDFPGVWYRPWNPETLPKQRYGQPTAIDGPENPGLDSRWVWGQVTAGSGTYFEGFGPPDQAVSGEGTESRIQRRRQPRPEGRVCGWGTPERQAEGLRRREGWTCTVILNVSSGIFRNMPWFFSIGMMGLPPISRTISEIASSIIFTNLTSLPCLYHILKLDFKRHVARARKKRKRKLLIDLSQNLPSILAVYQLTNAPSVKTLHQCSASNLI